MKFNSRLQIKVRCPNFVSRNLAKAYLRGSECDMDGGRVQLLLVATTTGNVIYERFYERFNEQEKAELRSAIAEAADSSSASTSDYSEHASRYRSGHHLTQRESRTLPKNSPRLIGHSLHY